MLDLQNETIAYQNSKLTESELEELFAIKAVINNHGILDNPFLFEKICHAVNHQHNNFDTVSPATILMIAKAVKIIQGHIKNVTWNNEIKWYIACEAFEEGWIKLPVVLSFAQPELDKLACKYTDHTEEVNQLQKLKHDAVEKYLQEN